MLPQVDGGGRGWGRQTLNKMSDKSDTKEGRKEGRKRRVESSQVVSGFMVTKRDSRNGKDSFQQVEIKTRTDLRKKRRGRTKTRAAVGEKERRVEIRRESATVGGGGRGGSAKRRGGEKQKNTRREETAGGDGTPESHRRCHGFTGHAASLSDSS